MVKGEQSPGQLDGEACCPGFVKGLLVRSRAHDGTAQGR